MGDWPFHALYRADSRLAPSQWETSLQNNGVSSAGRKPRFSPDIAQTRLWTQKTKDIPCCALLGKLWGLYFGEKWFLKKCACVTRLNCVAVFSVHLNPAQSRRHDRRPEEVSGCSDRNAIRQDCAQEMVHDFQGPRYTGRLYPCKYFTFACNHLATWGLIQY